jgi:hypothetical protein
MTRFHLDRLFRHQQPFQRQHQRELLLEQTSLRYLALKVLLSQAWYLSEVVLRLSDTGHELLSGCIWSP